MSEPQTRQKQNHTREHATVVTGDKMKLLTSEKNDLQFSFCTFVNVTVFISQVNEGVSLYLFSDHEQHCHI